MIAMGTFYTNVPMGPSQAMPRSTKAHRSLRARTQALRRAIAALDLLASGTVHVRTKVCGRENCRCAQDVNARHGPYHEWSRREDGRLLHSVVTPEQAKLLTEAINNHPKVQQLLDRWERETAAEILGA
jgi:hypothetical protein